MKNSFQFPGLDGRKTLEYSEGVLGRGKHNRCVVLPPANVPMVADSLERINQNW